MKIHTLCVTPATGRDPYGAVVEPLYQTATFHQDSAMAFGEFDYTRSGNPTRSNVEMQLAKLENGTYAHAFSSGMAAISTFTRLLSKGDEILAGSDLYGGTFRLMHQILPRLGVSVKYVDTSSLSAVEEAITPNTRWIYIETPTNPLLAVSDIRALAKLAHDHRAYVAVDNTMMSPILQKPLSLGADLVIHSGTKFLSGHSDISCGVIVTSHDVLHSEIAFHKNAEGSALSPFDSWLLSRSLKTLALRVLYQSHSARLVAEQLSKHASIGSIYYPTLPQHPGKNIHNAQASGGGAVISFTTGDLALSKKIAEKSRLFNLAVSFGSVHSSISLPCTMSHASIPGELRAASAPPQDLVRLSVGIEDTEDLLGDLEELFSLER